MTPEEFRTVRRLMIACVLATDMTHHAATLTEATAKLENPSAEKTFTISTLLHAADIGHCARPYEVTEEWTRRVSEEFFIQGDKEKLMGIEVSFI